MPAAYFARLGSLAGPITRNNVTGWVNLTSFAWGVGLDPPAPTTVTPRAVKADAVTVTRAADALSNRIVSLAFAAGGDMGPEKFSVASDTTSTPATTDVMTCVLDRASIVGLSYQASRGGGAIVERVSVTSTRITMTAKGANGNASSFTYSAASGID